MSTKGTLKFDRSTVHGFVESMLVKTKKPYAEIAAAARAKFKGETSPASVRHYASKLRQARVKLPDRPKARESEYVTAA